MNKRMIMMCLPCVVMVCFVNPTIADVEWTGDIDPADPTTWTSSTYAYIGKTSDGTLSITSGGNVVDMYGFIGFLVGSTGEVTVDGFGSTWTNLNIHVGYSGSGMLNITGGGTVISSTGTISSYHGSGEVTVDGPGSTWTNSYSFYVGDEVDGVLNITGGGAVSNSYGYIGKESGSTGEVTVDGSDSTWTNSSDLTVGESGSGTLDITGGGAVSNDGWSYIGKSSGSTGEVTVDGTGSTWTNSSHLYVGLYGSCTLNITGGGLVSVAGTMTIDHDTDGDGFINMATGGMLALSGDADDSLAAFLGLISGTDAIRCWDYPLGDWADITVATLGEDYTLSYITEGDLTGYTMLTVLEQPLLEGDADYSGVVSAGDYASVQANFGDTGIPGILGDANGDGVVSAGDYSSVQANFGNTAPTQVTPEPATISLMVIGGLIMLRRK